MTSKMPDDYQIPDDPDNGKMDAAYLRTCLGMRTPPDGPPPPLPAAVRRAHYDMARSLSLLGGIGLSGMDRTQLAVVVCLAQRDPEEPVEIVEATRPEITFLDIVNENLITRGGKVVVRFRNEDCPGHFLEVLPDNRILVLHDGSERKFKPSSVRLPDVTEFDDVASNINALAGV